MEYPGAKGRLEAAERVTEGYLILLRAAENAAGYAARVGSDCFGAYEAFRRAFAGFGAERYRGIMRAALEAYPSRDERELAEYRRQGLDLESDKAARMRLLEIVPETTPECCDDSFVDTYEHAVEVFGLLDRPGRWEIVRVRREVFAPGADTLGFDVGSWNGDHTSLIADTAVTPTWHSPPPEDWAETAERLAGLNGCLLFDDPAAAGEFLAWYGTKAWAETEGSEGEFCVVQVDAVGAG